MSLSRYRQKRDFGKTPEPRGGSRAVKGSAFVIQKHAARRLHYDLRLELDGVMLSWAVTRGPSLVPGEKRLAIHVEDHPIEYNSFEGTIPKGEYGGGTVLIWDRGQWLPEGDPRKGMAKGHLDFTLKGKKLKGRWHLVRMRKREGERQEPWLLIKSDDDHARGRREPDILEEKAKSVVSGRTIEKIAGAGDRVWHSNRAANDQPEAAPKRKPAVRKARAKNPAGKKPQPRKTRGAAAPTRALKKKSARLAAAPDPASVEGARRASLPEFVPPSLATLSGAPPSGAEWRHEIKFDGYRMQARLDGGRVRLLTRNGLNWTERFPAIAKALAPLAAQSALLDGEIVSVNERGISDFSALQEDLKAKRHDRMAYYVFDLLHLDGYDLTRTPLAGRRRLLEEFLPTKSDAALRLSEDFAEPGPLLLKHACRLGLEGVVSKRADAPYRSGRIREWIKSKCHDNQEFVIAGYEPSDKSSRSIRSLLLGYYDEGEFRYAGRVGTGFGVTLERDIVRKLEEFRQDRAPFDPIPSEERRRNVRWVEPRLVAEIDFRGWTHGEVLRQAAFKGLREDKPAGEVVRERQSGRAAAAAAKTSPRKSVRAAKTGSGPVQVEGVTLTHPDRVYWDDVGVTKARLAEYYVLVWKRMAPHLVDRPIALLRCPGGANSAQCFFQKHASAGIDASKLETVPIKGEKPMIAIGDLTGLIALAQSGVLELHTWGTTRDAIDTCNRLVFDLDPGPGVSFGALVDGAREVRRRLEQLKLKSFLKTTGGKGLHVVVPIAPAPWDDAKDFAHAIALSMEQDDPSRYVANMAKKLRNKRIFVDYLRNGYGATAIAPYSTRARPGATVSVPITWEELSRLKAPNTFTVLNAAKWLKKKDPWAGIGKVRQRIPDLKLRRR